VLKKLNPGLIRFPGGCFASFYQWKQGVGPKEMRKPEPSYFWGGLNNNDFGTDEFAMLCNTIGSEMMFCVNMYLPGKENYLSKDFWQYSSYNLHQISDPHDGIKNAVDWVAYCNLKKGEHPMADWRVKNGFLEPHGVKFWEMDNEINRWLTPEEYARQIVRYSEAMKAVDPTIKIGMQVYDFTGEIVKMLEIAGKHIDFLADRDDDLKHFDGIIELLNDYNAANNTQIKYCNTEWQVHPYPAQNPKDQVDERYLYGHKTKIKRSMVLGTWYCGLKAAGYLMNWQRKGSIIDFINFNNLANTHGQAVIETPKEGAYLTGPGKLYELISRTPARWPLIINGYDFNPNDMVQVQAAFSLNKDTLVIYSLNRSDAENLIEFDLSGLNQDFSTASISMLDADDIFARNKIDMLNEIRRTDWSENIKKNNIKLPSPPRSFIQAVLPVSAE
jgi:alpha-L-arabinofuranosidase